MLASGGQAKFSQKPARTIDSGRLLVVERKNSKYLSSKKQEQQIYLDYQATTPVDPRVFEAMVPFLLGEFGNPHSALHGFGRRAEAAVRRARQDIAMIVGALPEDVIITSGATEANNLALRGLAEGWRGSPFRLVSIGIEHPSVLEPAARLASAGFDVVILPVEAEGLVDLKRLDRELSRGLALVSVAAANNEIGVLQPIAEIAELCHRHGCLFHTDASQTVGKVPLDMYGMGIDLLTLSGHKAYGPKGIGALVATAESRRLLAPQMLGGGQQDGLRAGTVPVALCVGLGMACRVASTEMQSEGLRLTDYRARLLGALETAVGGVMFNGSALCRLPGNLSVCIAGVDAHQLIAMVPELAISTGSACASSGGHPSYVLKAIGLTDEEIRSSVRIGLGRFTTQDEVDKAADRLATAIGRLRCRESVADCQTIGP